jgi:hypothetical protein
VLKDIYGKPLNMKNPLGWGKLNEEPVETQSGD